MLLEEKVRLEFEKREEIIIFSIFYFIFILNNNLLSCLDDERAICLFEEKNSVISIFHKINLDISAITIFQI